MQTPSLDQRTGRILFSVEVRSNYRTSACRLPVLCRFQHQPLAPLSANLAFFRDIPKDSIDILDMAANDGLVHGWHSTDCGRGTSDILWSCLATILLCVWTVIHLPVPCCSRFEDGKLVPGEPSRSRRNWIIRSGIVPAVISVIAPEFLTFTAIKEFSEAWILRRKSTDMGWTLTHAFFFNMGGFCLETPSGLRLQLDDPQQLSRVTSPEWLSELKKVKGEHIDDHAKSNSLTKYIACGQALWLVTQVVSRICQHQAVTLLEVSTLAYAACALTAYTAWWKKPQNSTLPIMIPCSDKALPQANTDKPLYYSDAFWPEYVWGSQHWGREVYIESEILVIGLYLLCPAVFGAIHVASWNIKLLSNVEQWLWRASALYCVAIGMIVTLITGFSQSLNRQSWISISTYYILMTFALGVIPLVYVIARLFMIVEVFLSLRALPASAYESVRWSSFIPHI